MRIAVATERGGLDDLVSPNFGRAPTITFVDVDDATGEIVAHEVIENPYAASPSGAGTQASQLVAEKGAAVVLAGAFGPRASQVLEATGVRAVPASGPVRDAVLAVASGDAPSAGNAGPGAPGTGAGPGRGPGVGYGPPGWTPGAGPGLGAGMGRGGGMGMGRGMGRGGGWGRGGRGGRGRGGGGGWGRGGGGRGRW